MILAVVNYYFIPYFIVALEWMLLLFIFTCWFIIEIVKLVRKGKKGRQARFAPAIAIFTLLLLTYLRPQNRIIEQIDWYIFYNKRNEIDRKSTRLKSSHKYAYSMPTY